MINRIKWQLALALFWFLSAYLAIDAVAPAEWAWRCAWLNMIIGMVGLLLATRTERGARLFYRGPVGGEPPSLIIAFLWSIPVSIFFMAGIWWLMRLLGIFDW